MDKFSVGRKRNNYIEKKWNLFIKWNLFRIMELSG